RLAELMAMCCLGVGLLALFGQTPRPEPGPMTVESILEQREQLRAAGLEQFVRRQQLLKEGKEPQARRALIMAGERFRRVLDLCEDQPVLPGSWVDYHHRGRALMLLRRCAEARGFFAEAKQHYRIDTARLAVACWTSAGTPLSALAALPVSGRDADPGGLAAILACWSYCSTVLGEHEVALAGSRAA